MLEKIQSTQDLKQKAALIKEWLKQGDSQSEQILQYLDSELDSSKVKAWIKLCLKSKLFLLQKFKVKPEKLDENRFVCDLDLCTEPKEVTVLLQAYSKAMNSSHQEISQWLQGKAEDPALGKNCKKMLAYISKKPAPVVPAPTASPMTHAEASASTQQQLENTSPDSRAPMGKSTVAASTEPIPSESQQAASTEQETGPSASIDSPIDTGANQAEGIEHPVTQAPAESETSGPPEVLEEAAEVPVAPVQDQASEVIPSIAEEAPEIPEDIPEIPEEVPQIPDEEEQEEPVHPALIGISQEDEEDEEEVVFEEERSQGRFSGLFKLVSLVCIVASIGGFAYLYQQPSFSQYVDEVFRENSPPQLEELLEAPELEKLVKDPIPLGKMKKSPVDVVPQNEKVVEQMEQAQDIKTKHGNKGSKDDPRLDPSVISREFFGKKSAFLEAVLLFRRSTILTDIDAMYDLAYMYDEGRGVEESMEKAYIWYAFAALNGHPDAPDELEFLRDDLSDKQITRLAKITSGPIELVPFP